LPDEDGGGDAGAQVGVGDQRPGLSGGQTGEGAAVGADDLAGADGGDVHHGAAGLHRADPGDRELLQVLVRAAEVGVVGLEHQQLRAGGDALGDDSS
jgi:hypothetical protein